MKTLRNQLLLKLTHYLSGHLSRHQLIAWARDQLSQYQGITLHPALADALNYLCLLPGENPHQFALARAELENHKHSLERAGM
jgi:hypothetical protein